MMVPAAVAAQAVGKPVKVIYSREHDMMMDFSRPLTYQKMRAGVDDKGNIVGIDHDLVSAWPTKRWGIPAFLTLRRMARRALSTASPSMAPTSTIRCPTTRCARS